MTTPQEFKLLRYSIWVNRFAMACLFLCLTLQRARISELERRCISLETYITETVDPLLRRVELLQETIDKMAE